MGTARRVGAHPNLCLQVSIQQLRLPAHLKVHREALLVITSGATTRSQSTYRPLTHGLGHDSRPHESGVMSYLHTTGLLVRYSIDTCTQYSL